jgi:Ca2+-binding RTX toxin-like protein
VSGVEVLQASSLAGNSIAIGANAQAAGILSLMGGSASDILSAAGMSSGNIWIQGDAVGGASTLGDTLVAGTGTSRATLKGNDHADADNYFQISAASLLGNNSIVGGAASDDYLQITGTNQTLSDASFAQVSDLNGLILSGGSNNITLGVTAQAKFGATISLAGGANGGDTINLSATTNKVYLDASAGSTGDTITAGSNDNTLIGGSAASANDLFIFTSGSHLNGASIVGGGGTDTLRLSANGQTVVSADLDKLSNVEIFDLAGAGNNITLGNISAGIQTIVGGTGPNTFDASGYNSAPNALTWNMNASNGSDVLLGGADGNLFQIRNGANLQNSFITGNTGSDTIQLLAGAQTLGDSTFSNIAGTSIEQLLLGSATNGNSLTLGTIAASKGIDTVIGGTRRDTIDATAFNSAITIDASASSGSRLIGSTANTNQNTLIGGSAGGNEFVLGSISTNSLVGGSNGLDTLTLTQGGALIDTAFIPVSKIGTLKFEDNGNIVTLGTNALIAGIRTLVGGEGLDDGTGNIFNTSAYGSAGVLFQITDQDYLSNVAAIIGGTGVDTLKFSRDGVSVTDENVANLTNIDVLRTANGNNHFLIHDDFVAAGIDSIIGGTGRDTINMSDNAIYTPTGVADMITMDMSAGSGYTLISSTDDFLTPSPGNFRWAKVIGGSVAGSVILDGTNLADADFENMYQANIGTLFMRSGSDNTVVLGENARGTGLDTLTMSVGNDDIDVTDFLGTLAVNGGAGDDIVETSFAALASLTFTGGGGDDTLRLVGAEARSITSLAGSYEVFALEAGNNFVILANDAGLSTIFGGSGVDTISMLNNTTGINFVMDATRLGNTAGFASLDGGSGLDTLTVHGVAGGFADTQFARVGSVNWADDIGAIENFETDHGASGTYNFGTTAYAAGIQNVYAHTGDVLNAAAFNDGDAGTTDDRALNFIFVTEADAAAATVTGTGAVGNDTLTLTTDAQAVTDATFANKTSVETLVLANGANSVILSSNAQTAGLEVVIGGSGNDTITFDTTLQTSLVFNGGAQTTFDSATISNSGVTLTDAYFDDWASVEKLTTANGNNNIALGANAAGAGIATVIGGTGNDTFNATAFTSALWIDGATGNNSLIGASSANTLIGGTGNDNFTGGGANDSITGGGGTDTFYGGEGNDIITGGSGTDFLCGVSTVSAGTSSEIDTLTGGGGIDTFALADASNAYYNGPDAGGANYALIKDFTAGTDKLQLKTGVDYVIGGAIYGALGGANCYLYEDFNANLAVDAGENLIAAIIATGGSGTGGALTQADLAGNRILV